LLANLVVQQAMRVLKEQDVESADLYNIKGLLLMEEDNQVDALKAFQKATELEPNHTDAHMNMAMIALRFRAFQQAQKSLNVALRDRRQKKNIETYLGLGVAERGLRKYKEAEAAFKKAMEMGGGDPRPLYNLGILYQEHIAPSLEQYSEKPYDTAKEYFDRFTSKAGGNKAHQEAVADAKARIAAINQLKADMREMKELERKQKELEAQQKREEAAERKRLLELEQKAKASSAPPPAASPPAADNKGKKKK
jgi:tetratricopeptide (TPR) repeat protein